MSLVYVIGNGPSQQKFKKYRLHPSIGCNYAIKDFDLDHLVCADRMAVHAVRLLPPKANTKYWCKTSSLETPPGWSEFEFPGIDSGSAALRLAATLYPDHEILAIGFDGILGITDDNAYQYTFRPVSNAAAIRKRHRETIEKLLPDLPRTRFVGNTQDNQLETITDDQAFNLIKTQS